MDKLKPILINLLNEYTLESQEARQVLGLSKSRFATLKSSGKLVPLKGNLYFRKDVIDRLAIQEELRRKHYRRNSKK